MKEKLTKQQIDILRDKLITEEHGKFYIKGGQWACECFPDKKIKALYKIFNINK